MTGTNFFAVSMTALLQSKLLRAIGSMLQSQTTMVDMLQAERIAITSAFLLLFFVCGVALLQSRLIKAAGRWQQHRASMIQPRNHTVLSRTNTTAAELYYLRHMRSCAAAAMGNKGRDSSPSSALQISGASFIGRLLQSILRRCFLTVILPLGRLLQSIAQMVVYYAKIAMKLIIMSSALQRDMLILCTPLELAACFHLVEAYMHRDLYSYHCDSDSCRVSAVSAPSAQKIATIALALLIISLSIIDWHVPRCFRSHQLLCRILTAMSMQALRVELACTVIAFLLPTFGKRSQDQGNTSRKRSTPTRPATEQTPEIPADAEATMQDPGNASILRCSDSAVEPDAATEHIGMAWLSTIDDVTLISIFEHFANCYVSMPIVGTCRRIFITWTRKRRQLALEELTRLQSWLDEEEIRAVRRFAWSGVWRGLTLDGGNVPNHVVSNALCEIRDLIR